MSEWRSYHVYTSEVDRLIVDCVHPFCQEWESRMERRSWERHYAGGPNLRIRLQGPAAVVATAGEELAASARAFLAVHPSPDLASYSEAQVVRLLEWEETPSDAGEELRYRNNVVEEHPYPPATDVYVSREAARLMEDFRHDIVPLAFRLLTGRRPRREALLRLYFLKALEGSADIAAGSVSYKSHWEGFASSFPPLTVIERIQASYSANREYFQTLLREVADLFAQGRIDEDPEPPPGKLCSGATGAGLARSSPRAPISRPRRPPPKRQSNCGAGPSLSACATVSSYGLSGPMSPSSPHCSTSRPSSSREYSRTCYILCWQP